MHQTSLSSSVPDQVSQAFIPDRRGAARIECSIYASISINGAEVSNCIVKNISHSGARLLVPNGRWAPGDFEIVGLIQGVPIKARRVWRKGEEMGVRFVGLHCDALSDTL